MSVTSPNATHSESTPESNPWWRESVIYQIYPRSFADATGDGIGDLAGITSHLEELADLGVDAIWLSPFYTSPQNDAGYDVSDYCDVDPLFGTLDNFDAMTAKARELGLRVIVDIVPNHSSSEHVWFQAALAAVPGSPERDVYIFREGTGEQGELPPNNWQSLFGGPAWSRTTNPDGSPGQWYLHLFDPSQPDLNWQNPFVLEQFDDIFRFWLRRGVDGFRVDVAHGLLKAEGMPDWLDDGEPNRKSANGEMGPMWIQEGIHDIFRRWRSVLGEFGDDKILCAEAWVEPLSLLSKWVRPDEMNQAFNFTYLMAGWSAGEQRSVINESLDAFGSVGAPSSWVLSNHDVIRHASRLGLAEAIPQGLGIHPSSPNQPDLVLGARRARAATLLMLALPGVSYLYQGEELGLPEVIDIPGEKREDPTYARTGGKWVGRDGCRVPIPWSGVEPAYGFSTNGESWLPQPESWAMLSREAQKGDEASSLNLYKKALAVRNQHALGRGTFEWSTEYSTRNVLGFVNNGVLVVTNFGSTPVTLPDGEVLLASGTLDGELQTDQTAWILLPR